MAIFPNNALAKLKAGELALGFGVQHLRSVATPMLAKAAGFDWLFIDCEHGAFSMQEATQICLAALPTGITPLVRVCTDALDEGTRALDNAAMGIVVPHVDTAEQAKLIAAKFRFIAARFTRGDSVIFLAEEGGRALGFTQLYPGLSSLATAAIWLLNDLYVAPDGRRHGAGGALVERARRHAEETGAAGLELMTERGNTTAQRLYERLGWQRGDFVPYSLTLGPAS